ncbi:MAG: DUF192 domain-containing protein [Candidatus Dojkabacteria bacterium]|nr:MAG: DUF192 domain-containing protein [Candidatus Dojkabacteria bacterium]
MLARNLLGPTVIFCTVILFAVLILTMIYSTDNSVTDPRIVNSGLDDSWGRFTNADGEEVELLLEIADTEQKQRIGLMNRLDLHYDQGMLFAFESPRMGGFWMKNTLIYLDMIYIDSKFQVVDIVHYAAPCRIEQCRAYHPSSSYQYVVEVNGGWANENQVTEGSTFEINYSF